MSGAAPQYLVVGRIGRPHGISGEVRVEVLTDFPDRFSPGERLFVGPDGEPDPRPVMVESSRPHQSWLLVRFDVTPDRESAALLTNELLYIPASEARALGPDTYYYHELEGLDVATVDGQDLGRVREVMETGSADVLVVSDGERDRLIPMIGDVIASVDLGQGRITITPIPGLLDEG